MRIPPRAQGYRPEPLTLPEQIIGACILDETTTIDLCMASGIEPDFFTDQTHARVFRAMGEIRADQKPVTMEEVYERLGPEKISGGVATLMRLADTERIPDTRAVQSLVPKFKLSKTVHRTPFSFTIPAANDPSILLGNRYLNRGDGMVVASSSGMGKSSMSHQMAAEWALGEPFVGITPNGSLRILIVQSEDSDGDIAEVWQSIKHVKKYTDIQIGALEKNIRIISERSLRGTRFIRWLQAEVEDFKPDLVFINPLQAFIDGDVTESKDLGEFLREGLNGINRESKFGYVITHHTTKPATGKDRSERLWHEVMYDMAGGAELINWARAIISLRPLETRGEFKLVLAKRGRRAGVTAEVEQGAGTRMEPVTEIGLKHSDDKLPSGHSVIFWEPMKLPDPPRKNTEEKLGGRQPKYLFTDYRYLFPPASGPGKPLDQLYRDLFPNGEIKKNILHQVCKRWADENDVEIIDVHGQPRRYRATV